MKIAFDIVLLPSENLSDIIINLNHSLKRDYSNSRISLNNENCIPHISLLMGIAPLKSLPQIKTVLGHISQNFKPLDLEIISLDSEDLQSKDRVLKIVGFSLGKSNALSKLHESLVKEIKPYFDSRELAKEMFYNPNEIDIEDAPWMFPYIQNFLRNSSYDNFNPHITIGDGFIEEQVRNQISLPRSFTASRLAIYHLGNYCTCRKVLYETRFEGIN